MELKRIESIRTMRSHPGCAASRSVDTGSCGSGLQAPGQGLEQVGITESYNLMDLYSP